MPSGSSYFPPPNGGLVRISGTRPASAPTSASVTESRTVQTRGGAHLPVSSGTHAWSVGDRALLCLRPEALRVEEAERSAGGIPGTEDLCFIVTVDAEQVIAHLQRCGVTVEQGPVAKDGALGPITSVYCRDPDGNLIEIATYGTAP